MNLRILGLMGLALAGSLSLAACSAAQPEVQPTAAATVAASESTAPTEAAAASSGAGAVSLDTKTLDTFVYEPNAWTTTAGAETTINLDNSAGTQEHTWVVLKKDVAKDAAIMLTEADAEQFIFSVKAAPGQKQSDTFTAPTETGDYLVICNIAGHAAGGMVGTLTVN